MRCPPARERKSRAGGHSLARSPQSQVVDGYEGVDFLAVTRKTTGCSITIELIIPIFVEIYNLGFIFEKINFEIVFNMNTVLK